ncbi:Putative LOC100164329, partial [Caligus rogercresseyi]
TQFSTALHGCIIYGGNCPGSSSSTSRWNRRNLDFLLSKNPGTEQQLRNCCVLS